MEAVETPTINVQCCAIVLMVRRVRQGPHVLCISSSVIVVLSGPELAETATIFGRQRSRHRILSFGNSYHCSANAKR